MFQFAARNLHTSRSYAYSYHLLSFTGGKFLICDCHISWVVDWIQNKDLQVTSRERNPQFCGEPAYLRQRSFYELTPEQLVCNTSSFTVSTSTTILAPNEIIKEETAEEPHSANEISDKNIRGASAFVPVRPPTTTTTQAPQVNRYFVFIIMIIIIWDIDLSSKHSSSKAAHMSWSGKESIAIQCHTVGYRAEHAQMRFSPTLESRTNRSLVRMMSYLKNRELWVKYTLLFLKMQAFQLSKRHTSSCKIPRMVELSVSCAVYE